jgi:hypothetical protein
MKRKLEVAILLTFSFPYLEIGLMNIPSIPECLMMRF